MEKMRYFKIYASNGYCGCDEAWLAQYELPDEATEEEIEEIIQEDIFGFYDYIDCDDRYCDITEDELEETEYDFIGDYYIYEQVLPNSGWEEVTETEFSRLRFEEGYRVY